MLRRVAVFAVLTDSSRRRILDMLRERSVNELVADLGLSQPGSPSTCGC